MVTLIDNSVNRYRASLLEDPALPMLKYRSLRAAGKLVGFVNTLALPELERLATNWRRREQFLLNTLGSSINEPYGAERDSREAAAAEFVLHRADGDASQANLLPFLAEVDEIFERGLHTNNLVVISLDKFFCETGRANCGWLCGDSAVAAAGADFRGLLSTFGAVGSVWAFENNSLDEGLSAESSVAKTETGGTQAERLRVLNDEALS